MTASVYLGVAFRAWQELASEVNGFPSAIPGTSEEVLTVLDKVSARQGPNVIRYPHHLRIIRSVVESGQLSQLRQQGPPDQLPLGTGGSNAGLQPPSPVGVVLPDHSDSIPKPVESVGQAQSSSPEVSVVMSETDETLLEYVGLMIFGRKMSKTDLAQLCYAPRGSVIEADVCVESEHGIPKIDVRIIHPYFMSHRKGYEEGIGLNLDFFQRDGQLVCEWDWLRLPDDAPPGAGVFVHDQMVRRLRAGKVNRLVGEAAGGSTETETGKKIAYGGYYAWARMGWSFQQTLAELADKKFNGLKALPPAEWQAETVSDLMQTSEGRKWWRENGVTGDMYFDLSPDSPNGLGWQAYRQEKAHLFPAAHAYFDAALASA